MAPGGQPSVLGQLVADTAGTGITGPFTSTLTVPKASRSARALPHIQSAPPPNLPELEAGEPRLSSQPAVEDPVVQLTRSGSLAGPNMPGPLQSFAGISRASTIGYFPPDTNGDVGPIDYVQTVNDNVAVYNKATGVLQAPIFSYNALWSGANTGTPCDANNNGDPVAVYDRQADRWILSDFAWIDHDNGPFYECLAVSQTNDPSGFYWLYALRTDDDTHKWFADYPKLGVWPDGLYLSANMYLCSSGCASYTYEGARVWAIESGKMYAHQAPQVVHFDLGASAFTALPSNYRGTAPPAGTPNYFVANVSNPNASIFALDVWAFRVNWTHLLSSTISSSPTQVNVAPYSYPPLPPAATIPEPSGANGLDSLEDRLMMQNQYRRIGASESLWLAHTADNAPTGVRWYQLNVTGGAIANTPLQQGTYRPDASYRWIPSLAVDKYGNMAIGYSVSGSGVYPSIRYAGRLAGDHAGQLGQGETSLMAGSGGQTGDCVMSPCIRWGDYSAMTVDPADDCTFWYTNEYYAASDSNWQTRIGSFRFPGCNAVYSNFTYLPLVTNNSWINLIQEGFEGAWPSTGWTLEDNVGGAYDWGKRACQASSGSFSGWAIGGGSVGAGLSCGANYPNNTQISMIHAPVSLVGATAAEFDLQVSANTAAAGDTLAWLASLDGNTFYGVSTSGNSGGFGAQTLNLSSVPLGPNGGNFLGQPQVWIAVVFQSDASGNAPNGAFVDDLLVRECLAPTCGSLARPATAGGNVHAVAITLKRPAR